MLQQTQITDTSRCKIVSSWHQIILKYNERIRKNYMDLRSSEIFTDSSNCLSVVKAVSFCLQPCRSASVLLQASVQLPHTHIERVLVHLYLFRQETCGKLQERVKHLWAICSVYQVPGAQFDIDIPRATKLLCLRVQNKGQSSFTMVDVC